jgi:hypothetical protein
MLTPKTYLVPTHVLAKLSMFSISLLLSSTEWPITVRPAKKPFHLRHIIWKCCIFLSIQEWLRLMGWSRWWIGQATQVGYSLRARVHSRSPVCHSTPPLPAIVPHTNTQIEYLSTAGADLADSMCIGSLMCLDQKNRLLRWLDGWVILGAEWGGWGLRHTKSMCLTSYKNSFFQSFPNRTLEVRLTPKQSWPW